MKFVIALSLVFLMSVTACTSTKCFIKDKASAAMTNVVVEKLQCQNPAAVKASMDSIISSTGLCTEAKTGPIATAVCPILTKAVVDFVGDKAIPAEWKCSAVNAKALLGAAINSACVQLPVSN